MVRGTNFQSMKYNGNFVLMQIEFDPVAFLCFGIPQVGCLYGKPQMDAPISLLAVKQNRQGGMHGFTSPGVLTAVFLYHGATVWEIKHPPPPTPLPLLEDESAVEDALSTVSSSVVPWSATVSMTALTASHPVSRVSTMVGVVLSVQLNT